MVGNMAEYSLPLTWSLVEHSLVVNRTDTQHIRLFKDSRETALTALA